jgi:hypothetical protein
MNMHMAELIEARQAAGHRYISLVMRAATERFQGRMNPARRAEILAAKARWEAAKRAAAESQSDGPLAPAA